VQVDFRLAAAHLGLLLGQPGAFGFEDIGLRPARPWADGSVSHPARVFFLKFFFFFFFFFSPPFFFFFFFFCLLCSMGPMAKSAPVTHAVMSGLPDAMEGPTPDLTP